MGSNFTQVGDVKKVKLLLTAENVWKRKRKRPIVSDLKVGHHEERADIKRFLNVKLRS